MAADDRAATHSSGPAGAGGVPSRTATAGGTGTHEHEIVKLRRSMIQQLTASGKLLNAVFTLDREYFGTRFTAEHTETGGDPFQELALATKIVETLAEELQGSSAFADSPVLRDNIANLVAGVHALRTGAIELERAQIEALHLPAKTEFAARTFPDNNPLACLTEAAGFLREMAAAIARAKDRTGALTMMLHDAEKARDEASSHAPAGNRDELTSTLRAELKARDGEVAQLRAQAKQLQEQAAADVKRLQHNVEHVRHELTREQDLRRGDLAETRSLAAEIERLAGFEEQLAERDGRSEAQELTVNLAELRDALGDAQRSEAIATAAESVLIEWARVVTARAQSHSAELARVKAGADALQLTVQQQRDQLGRLGEAEKQGGEAQRLREAIKSLEGEVASARAQAAAAGADAAKLRTDVARIETLEKELARANDAKGQAEAAAAQAASDKGAAQARVAALEGQAAERAKAVGEEIAAHKQAAAQARAAAEESGARERQIVGELAKAREAMAQSAAQIGELKSAIAKLNEERAQLSAKVDDQRGKTDVISRDRERQAAELKRQIEALNERIAELEEAAAERSGLRAKLDEARRESTISEEKAQLEKQDLARQLASARSQTGEEQSAHAQTRQERDQLRARLDDLRRATEAQAQQADASHGQLGREVALMREAESRLKSQLASASAEANRAAARAGELERELQGHREQAAARAREHAHAIEQLRAREVEAREKSDIMGTELAQAKSRAARLEHDLAAANRQVAELRERRPSGVFAAIPAATANEVAELKKRLDEHRQLLIDARAAVLAAKERLETQAETDRRRIAALIDEVKELKSR